MKSHLFSGTVLTLAAGCLLAATAFADPQYKNTEVTFNAPVEIPGHVLMPGTYVMKVLNPSNTAQSSRFTTPLNNTSMPWFARFPRITRTSSTTQ